MGIDHLRSITLYERLTHKAVYTKINYYTIIEWFRGIHWIICCENLQNQPSGRRPRGWYCKFEQNIIQYILRNLSIIVLSHRLLRERRRGEGRQGDRFVCLCDKIICHIDKRISPITSLHLRWIKSTIHLIWVGYYPQGTVHLIWVG